MKQLRIWASDSQPMSELTRFSPLDRLRTSVIRETRNKTRETLESSLFSPSRSPPQLLSSSGGAASTGRAPQRHAPRQRGRLPLRRHGLAAAARRARREAQHRRGGDQHSTGAAASTGSKRGTAVAAAWPSSPPLVGCRFGWPAAGRTQQ